MAQGLESLPPGYGLAARRAARNVGADDRMLQWETHIRMVNL